MKPDHYNNDHVIYECRQQYNETGSTEIPEKYKGDFHKRASWRGEVLRIIRDETRGSMYG